MSKDNRAEELFRELKGIHSKIKQIRSKGIRESSTLDSLLEQSEKLGMELDKRLSKGEKLSDPLLDYCFARFDGYSYINQSGERAKSESTFDVVPLVKDFLKDIKNSIGEKILETYDNVPKQIGIISGNCFFEMERTFRDLYVPTKNLLVFKDREWKEGKDKMGVEKDIFEYPVYLSFRISHWLNDTSRLLKDQNKKIKYETDHSKNIYFGGSAPKETAIYIGSNYVDKILKTLKDKEITIKTEKRIKVPIPNLS